MNFTERVMWFMNLPTNVRGDLPPETYRTSEFLLSSCENFKISLKPCTLHIWSFLFYLHDMWNRIRTPFYYSTTVSSETYPIFPFSTRDWHVISPHDVSTLLTKLGMRVDKSDSLKAFNWCTGCIRFSQVAYKEMCS